MSKKCPFARCTSLPTCLKKMAVCIFLHARKVENKKVKSGLLLYPTDFGRFKNDTDKAAFDELFTGAPPPVPYAGFGTRFGPEQFSINELRSAMLDHMRAHYSEPKDLETYWIRDKQFHDKLVFDPSVVYQIMEDNEEPLDAAIRAVWESTGVKMDREELKFVKTVDFKARPAPQRSIQQHALHVFRASVSIDRAKWDWMSHQGERLTLTDWRECPFSAVLDELCVPRLVKTAYCSTHGGPKFISALKDVKDAYTKEIIQTVHLNF